MAVTVGQLAAALRITDGSDPAEPQLSILTRLAGVADAYIDLLIPGAPTDIQDECKIRFAAYLYDAPTAGRGDFYANAWRNSGAGSLGSRWVVRRAAVQADLSGTVPTSGGLDSAQVQALIDAGDFQNETEVQALIDATTIDGADLSDEKPKAAGTAAAGVGTKASRDDHVHPASGEGGGVAIGGIEHRLDVVEAKTADLIAASDEPGAFVTVSDVAAQGGLSDRRSTRPTLVQAQAISGYAATRTPGHDAGIYVVRLPITVDKSLYQIAVAPGDDSGLQPYELPSGAWHRLGADESFQYFYFPFPYRLASVTLQVAANAGHIGQSAYEGAVHDPALLHRIDNLYRLTADLRPGNPASGWSASTDTAVAGVAVGEDDDRAAALAATYLTSITDYSAGRELVIRVRASDDPSQFRIRHVSNQGQVFYASLHSLVGLGLSADEMHAYYWGGRLGTAVASTRIEVTGTAAHKGTSQFLGKFKGALEDEIVTLDALAAAVAARLLPATLGDAGQVLQVNSGKTAAEWAAAAGGLSIGDADKKNLVIAAENVDKWVDTGFDVPQEGEPIYLVSIERFSPNPDLHIPYFVWIPSDLNVSHTAGTSSTASEGSVAYIGTTQIKLANTVGSHGDLLISVSVAGSYSLRIRTL